MVWLGHVDAVSQQSCQLVQQLCVEVGLGEGGGETLLQQWLQLGGQAGGRVPEEGWGPPVVGQEESLTHNLQEQWNRVCITSEGNIAILYTIIYYG